MFLNSVNQRISCLLKNVNLIKFDAKSKKFAAFVDSDYMIYHNIKFNRDIRQ